MIEIIKYMQTRSRKKGKLCEKFVVDYINVDKKELLVTHCVDCERSFIRTISGECNTIVSFGGGDG